MTTSIETCKKRFNRSVQAFEAVLKVKPNPTIETLEKSYTRVQKQLDAVFNSADQLILLLETSDSAATEATGTELGEITTFYEKLLNDQCVIETKYVEFRQGYTTTMPISPTIHVNPQTIGTARPTVRLTPLTPPSWNGICADFYTWQRKFVHIMDEARITDELTQLCYLQNSETLSSEYQTLITDCTTMTEVWSRLEERMPREVIKYEIISHFRNLKPLPSKKTPTILRNFANEVSLFCRRMDDLGIQKESYSCIILQDVYERLDHDRVMRYRCKVELKRELLLLGKLEDGKKSLICEEDLDSLSIYPYRSDNNGIV